MSLSLTRREFLAASAGTALAATGLLPGVGLPATAFAELAVPEKVFLKSWELVELPNLVMRPDKDGRKMALRITATITQCSTDVYITGGVTNALRMMQYAKDHPPLVINLHWAWMPQAHLAMACEEKLIPLVEFPMGEDFPKSLLDGPHLLAPDWPGIYKLD